MELTDLLDAFDRTAANLAKLEGIWERAQGFMPKAPSAGSDPEYDDLRRSWLDLLPGLPKIDGWTITEELPDISVLGKELMDWFEIGEPAWSVYEQEEQPGKDLAEYRYRLNRARRRAVRERLGQLVGQIDDQLSRLVRDLQRDSMPVTTPLSVEVRSAFGEIERLMGATTRTSGRWSDLHRHLSFGQGHDWHDIHALDWPDVKPDVLAAGRDEADPLPVPNIDLGHAASESLTGSVTSALPWDRLTDEGFERLLYDLIRDLANHQNVQWLQRTRAADRGRDLSCERVTQTGAGATRTERVIVQAKHWQSRSVGASEIATNVANMDIMPPPLVRVLVVATSGAFTGDAVDWTERHNEKGRSPHVELWPYSHLEMLIAQRPELAAAHGLR